ncbi:hypothetical protein [Embleya sp. MST-111070]|uniref:hypothetical protein n=1 Tax=Embleya sp. MST-111070 TaxID=3398231 RepID=UPI003F74019D
MIFNRKIPAPRLAPELDDTELGKVCRLEVVDRVRATAPATAPVAGLPLYALVDRYIRTVAGGGVDAFMAEHLWSGREATSTLTSCTSKWAQDGLLVHAEALRDLNMLAFALVAARRIPPAAPVFQRIRGVVTPAPWNYAGEPPVVAFARAQQRVKATR